MKKIILLILITMPQITYFQILILIRKLKVIRGVKVLSCRLIPIKMYSFYIFFYESILLYSPRDFYSSNLLSATEEIQKIL